MKLSEKHFNALQKERLRQHFDAGETMFLERELTQLRARIFEVVFPDLMARSFLPKANDIASSAETFAWKVLTPLGDADVVANTANDLPRVDVTAREVLGKVRNVGAAYGWGINELREAARLGVPLSDLKAQTARTAIERGIDLTLAFGSLASTEGMGTTDFNVSGFCNNTDIVNNTILAGAYWFAGSPPTPSAILADMAAPFISVVTATKSKFRPDTLLMPTRHYTYVQQTPFSTLSGESILTVFLKNNPGVQVFPWYRLDTAGAASVPRMIAYQKDPQVLEAVIPQEFEQLPPEAKGLEFVVNCTGRCGGVKVYQPTACKFTDFATS